MTDFRSGYKWTKLNTILADNFAKFMERTDHDWPKFQALQSLTTILTSACVGVKFIWSGSMTDKTLLDPGLREEGIEYDFMLAPDNFIISYTQQRNIFRYIPDAPGHVKLEVTQDQASFLKKTILGLTYKQDPLQGGNEELSRYYLTADKCLEGMPGDLLSVLPDNIFKRTIADTLDLRHCLLRLIPGQPALNLAMSGLSSICEEFESPKKFVCNLLGNLCSRFGNDVLCEEENPDDDLIFAENATWQGNNRKRSFDYVCMPTQSPKFPKGIAVDIAPSIECVGWPEIALPYFQRKRNWPDTAMLTKLHQGGFHLVHKPLDKDSAESVEWRMSFSVAETTLFNSLDDFKLNCYRIFKAIYYCELTLPKVLCSYYMKTIFLWTCERLPAEAWVESNRAQVIMGMLDELLHCLVTKHCPHYFIPECNLFAHAHEEFLMDLARRVSEIRTHPDRYPKRTQTVEWRTRWETGKRRRQKAGESLPDTKLEIDMD